MGEMNLGRMLRRAQMFGDRPAIKDLGTGYEANYKEHIDRVGRLCSAITGLGVGPSDRVAVLASGSHVYVELWRACLAGSAMINPLNPRLAPDELVYIMTDSASEVIFVDAAHAGAIAEVRERLPRLRKVVLIGDGDVPHDARLDDLMAVASSSELPPEPDDGAAAVLMYTGGTTGLPKGVVLSQRAVVLSVYRMQPVVALREPQSFLAFIPFFHIAGMAAWAFYLPTGGRSVIMPQFEPGAVDAAIRDERITAIGSVPTMLTMMLEHPDFDPEMLASLELVMYGASPMPAELLDELMRLCPNIGFHQAYGMTEIAAIATGLSRDDHERGGDILRSVGRPAMGVELEIRHPETAEPLPQGEIGEIWLRADSLMTEYWNKPEQTAASLVDGWYRSGDAARVDAQGYVFMADRVKDMIISGGENVYSLEVENAIRAHPAVRQVAVIGLPDGRWGERVHAVVVCEPGAVAEEELEATARERIAGYKVPRSWTFQAEPLPLSAAAKVLKRELRERLTSEQVGR
jgi:acyl-CoA synthetase (AMP-forming)/AMP-acid ligase II